MGNSSIIGLCSSIGVVICVGVLAVMVVDLNSDVNKWRGLAREAINKTDQTLVLVNRATSIAEECMERLAAQTTQ